MLEIDLTVSCQQRQSLDLDWCIRIIREIGINKKEWRQYSVVLCYASLSLYSFYLTWKASIRYRPIKRKWIRDEKLEEERFQPSPNFFLSSIFPSLFYACETECSCWVTQFEYIYIIRSFCFFFLHIWKCCFEVLSINLCFQFNFMCDCHLINETLLNKIRHYSCFSRENIFNAGCCQLFLHKLKRWLCSGLWWL